MHSHVDRISVIGASATGTMTVPRDEKDCSMNSRFFKVCAAALLAVGLSTVSIAAPADAAILKKASSGPVTNDTGWGYK
jgi:hypothetical protein